MRSSAERSKNLTSRLDIQYILCDTIANDYSSLARTTQKATAIWSEEWKHVSVFPMMVARSYLEQVAPNKSVHLGYSFSCLQWLDQAPTDLSSSPGIARDRISSLNSRQVTYQAQADRELHKFLLMRASEFQSGATLIVAFVGNDQTCKYWDTPVMSSLVEALDTIVDEHETLAEAADTFSPPIYLRTLEETNDMLQRPDIRSVWTLQQLEETDVSHPLSERLNRDDFAGDKRLQYAEKMMDFGIAIFSQFMEDVIQRHISPEISEEGEKHHLFQMWRSRAIEIFMKKHSDAEVKFRWIYFSLKRL